MAQPLPYSIHYITAPQQQQPQYLIAPHPQHAHVPGQVHLVSPQMRPEQPQRKRPKYTRSKTGCLTCRSKKIKCDESKPKCQRCAHGQRECTWPDPAPPKKKTTARKNSNAEDRPSTSDSGSRISDSSSTSRDVTPNLRDLSANVVPASGPERRHSEPQAHAYAMPGAANGRRQTLPDTTLSHTLSSSSLGSVAEYPSYSTSMGSSYNMAQPSSGSVSSHSDSRPSTANSLPPVRYPSHNMEGNHYHSTSVLPSVDARDSYAHPRWETLPSRSNTGSFGYSSSMQDNEILNRHYSHEHNSRI